MKSIMGQDAQYSLNQGSIEAFFYAEFDSSQATPYDSAFTTQL